jgi:hypothetical protein
MEISGCTLVRAFIAKDLPKPQITVGFRHPDSASGFLFPIPASGFSVDGSGALW